jgi:hypothetical protein
MEGVGLAFHALPPPERFAKAYAGPLRRTPFSRN